MANDDETRSAKRRAPADDRWGDEPSGLPALEPPPTPTLSIPPSGRYEEYGVLGRGGMGMVLRVHDRHLRRDVAMKKLDGLGEAWTQIFVEEAQITAQLEHPNIVPVHELGREGDDTHYFTMKMVQGVTLKRWLDTSLLDRRSPAQLGDALEVFLKICDAISFAHSRGIVHGDLKPDNVMVGSFGEVYVMDWGLAQLIRSAPATDSVEIGRRPGQARFGEGALGTPAYMPPEQTVGRPGTIDAQSDVFALGALLYHVVVGRPPYTGRDANAVLEAAKEVRFVPPEQAAPEGVVSPGLARVIKRAMSREKSDRHVDVRELKHDLQRAMRGGTHLPSRWFPAGHVFCREGDAGSEAYVIAQGRCVAYRTGPDGTRQVLREMGPGAVFGEMAVISDTPRTATVEALEPMLVQIVSKQLLEDELGLDAWVGAFVKALAQRFRDLEDQVRGPRSLPPR